MTRDEAREFAKVVQAYADGKDVQYEAFMDAKWKDAQELELPNHCHWRIKPGPRECWQVRTEEGNVVETYDDVDSACSRAINGGHFIIHFREVMP